MKNLLLLSGNPASKRWPGLFFGWIFFLYLVSSGPAAFAGAATMTLVTEEYAPLSYTQDGQLRGYSVEIAEELLKRAQLNYTIGAFPWARAYEMARLLPNVLIFSIVRTPEREPLFHWIGPLRHRSVYFYKLAARKDLQVGALEDLKRYKTSVNRGDILQIQLEQIGLQLGGQIDLSNTTVSSLRKLLSGRVDFIVSTEFALNLLCERAGVAPASLERTLLLSGDTAYYIAASLATPQPVVEHLKRQFGLIKDSGFMAGVAAKYGVK